ncbi:MAG: bifunctional 4-hydroxy-2-oxoglutarate aldolase/2-dehydro-3-deoxy-phosphogluconate aldolase [Caulobacterales bacterium]|nr:bifunctional 4-hydroxy-2-oxoglutarate aldolase/2-dehydro-3-deoxy-phosphogluconate aldolase [Caulobacterales bacterium]
MTATIDDILTRASVIPVLTVHDAARAGDLAKALAAGGLEVVEMTLRTPAALAALGAMKTAAPELAVGMGTLRTSQDVRASLDAGADFLVTPGMSPSLSAAFADLEAAVLPGAMTPSEAATLFEHGFRAQKFFPAEQAGGISMLKALHGPLPDITFCPTGGISRERAGEYLALPNVACVGGSWIAPGAAIADGDWASIEANARFAAGLKG